MPSSEHGSRADEPHQDGFRMRPRVSQYGTAGRIGPSTTFVATNRRARYGRMRAPCRHISGRSGKPSPTRSPMRRRSSRAPAASTGGLRAARRAARPGAARRRPRTPRQGRDVSLQLARVLRDELRGDEDPRRPDQRQLPLPRRRARLPARQRRRRGARLPLARSATASRACAPGSRSCGCSSRSTTGPPPTAPRHVDGAVRYDELQRALAPGGAHRARGRRDLHALHRRHDGHAEGRDVRDDATSRSFFLKTYPR